MSVDLAKRRLPKRGAIVAVSTEYGELFVGALVGIVPGQDRAKLVKDRSAKLALRNDAMSCAIPQRDIREIKTLKRAPRQPVR